jgi:hypothetical protein
LNEKFGNFRNRKKYGLWIGVKRLPEKRLYLFKRSQSASAAKVNGQLRW